MSINYCKTCGAPLTQRDEYTWECGYCHNVYSDRSVRDEAESLLKRLLQADKLEKVANLRKNLYDAVNEKYTDSNEICSICGKIKALLPDDFMANFYHTANRGTPKEICEAIKSANAVADISLVEGMVRHIVRSLHSKYVLPLQNLVERAYKETNLRKFEELSTLISTEAEKINSNWYNTAITRDAFIAYSSKDMDKVEELVEYMEENGKSCFVAARNLRQGRGAVQNYERAIYEAIDNCKWIIFVSTPNSRSMECDALGVELKYVKSHDVEAAPPEYRQADYHDIPEQYKKLRVQYRVDNTPSCEENAERMVSDFFSGFTHAYSPEEVVNRINNPPHRHTPVYHTEPQPPMKSRAGYVIAVLLACLLTAVAFIGFRSCSNEGTGNSTTDKSELVTVTDTPTSADTTSPPDSTTADTTAETTTVHSHLYGTWVTARQATCSEEGEKVRVCSCGETDKQPISKLPHTEVTDTAVAATCTKTGLTEGKHCSVCGTVTLKQSVIEAYHIPAVWDTVKKPTKTENGLKRQGCTRCSAILAEEVIPAIGSQGLEYKVNSDNTTCSVTGIGTCKDTELYIPEYIDGYKVTVVSSNAFSSCDTLVSITIPNSVTHIGNDAFAWCDSLVNVTIPNGVTSIGNDAFYDCDALKGITIPNSVTSIGNYAFYSCDALESITIPSSVTSIGNNAFSSCDTLVSITIPNSVTHIGSYAFAWCNSLVNVTIPNGVTSIGNNAFYDCDALEGITIPNSVTEIGNNAFSYCPALNSVTIPDSVTELGDNPFVTLPISKISVSKANPFYKKEGNCIIETQTGRLVAGDETSVIPSSVTSIGNYAFYSCDALESITIPSSVTHIGNYAFGWCDSIVSIIIPSGVTHIGIGAFIQCNSLTTITIPNGVTSIGNDAFYDCDALESITIPNSVTEIGSDAFSYCPALNSVTIPESVTELGDNPFADIPISKISVSKANTFYKKEGNCIIEIQTGRLVAEMKQALFRAVLLL